MMFDYSKYLTITTPKYTDSEVHSVTYLDDDFIVSTAQVDAPKSNQSATGYGKKIPTTWVACCLDNRVRRVYAICYGNASSLYVIVQSKRVFIDSCVLLDKQN